jgi:hypothetical protein
MNAPKQDHESKPNREEAPLPAVSANTLARCLGVSPKIVYDLTKSRIISMGVRGSISVMTSEMGLPHGRVPIVFTRRLPISIVGRTHAHAIECLLVTPTLLSGRERRARGTVLPEALWGRTFRLPPLIFHLRPGASPTMLPTYHNIADRRRRFVASGGGPGVSQPFGHGRLPAQ